MASIVGNKGETYGNLFATCHQGPSKNVQTSNSFGNMPLDRVGAYWRLGGAGCHLLSDKG